MFEWGDLRYLLAIAREQTLVAAGRRLGVNQTTVGRRIVALEEALGARLFNRVDQRWVPTTAGLAAIRRAERIESEVLGTATEIAGVDQSLTGSVRLTSVGLVITNLLAPRVGELINKYPGIDLELIDSPRNLDLQHLEADLALRVARPSLASAVTRKVGVISFRVYVSRRYTHISEPLPWVVFAKSMDNLPEARWLARQTINERPLLRVNDVDTMMTVVGSMPCRALLPDVCVASTMSDLVSVSGPEPLVKRDLWLVYMEALRHNARVAAVRDWAFQTCRDGLSESTLHFAA